MFKIRFNPNISDAALSRLSLEDFQEDYGNALYGQFEIRVNEYKYGLYDEDAPREIRDFFEESILAWLTRLNDTVGKINDHEYIALNTIDDNLLWFEFMATEENDLQMSLVQVEHTFTGEGYMVTEQIEQISKCLWRAIIRKHELIHEVLEKTDEFIRYMGKVNPLLLKSKSMEGLIKSHERAQNCRER